MKLSQEDLNHIEKHQSSVEKIKNDLSHFEHGFSNTEIVKPATLGDGIINLSSEDESDLINTYENCNSEPVKFVPASGAASRMFRLLHQFLEEFPTSNKDFKQFVQQDKFQDLAGFFNSIDKLAFYDDLKLGIKQKGIDFEALSEGEKALELTKQALTDEGFNMANLPKGLIPFHNYGSQKLTAFEEHFYEASHYAVKNKKAKLHFTISKGHLEKFQNKLLEVQSRIESETGVNFEVDFSFQHPSTDTICLNADGEIFRDKNGDILFRPAGHGALIQNLNELKSDLVFIKNIDNVAHQKSQDEKTKPTHKYKSILAGLLIKLQEKTFSFLTELNKEDVSDQVVKEAKDFLKHKLNVHIQLEDKADVMHYLNRPIRVCGMVINEGAPGGGPFWIKNNDGSISLQIVEKSQIDLSNANQKDKMEGSTHFNPVDIVASLKNYKGELFNLQNFVDKDRGFIANKFVGGEPIKGLELPGLWNGGMACWNTVFVEVPVHTFNPVKTVLDLLKPGHQPG